jgi:branched-chain amino acid transport system ATP-binding protein
VLSGVSLRVPNGKIVALLGPNGAGKTTTLRTIAGVVRPTEGAIALDGQNITSMAPYRRAEKGVCLIPEGRGIFRSLTVHENLRLYHGSMPVTTETLDRAYSAFPVLKPRSKETAGRLSGGQQQMLALARAYIRRPRLVLLDEVSMGLAPLIVEEIFEAMTELAKTGAAMLLVEQYVARTLTMADSVVLLNKGQTVYDGPAASLDEETILKGYLGVEKPGS